MSENIIETVAPLSVAMITRNFTEPDLTYVIDYANSKIKGPVFLTYLSNLDLKYHVRINTVEDGLALLKAYMNLPMLVSIPELEDLVVEIIAAYKKLPHDLLFDPTAFIEENIDIVKKWCSVVESLSVFSMFSCGIDEHREYVNGFKVNEDNSPIGCNFVHLCKHPKLPYIITSQTQPQIYINYFTNNMFRGKNLFTFWAVRENICYTSYMAMQHSPVEFDEAVAMLSEEIKAFGESECSI